MMTQIPAAPLPNNGAVLNKVPGISPPVAVNNKAAAIRIIGSEALNASRARHPIASRANLTIALLLNPNRITHPEAMLPMALNIITRALKYTAVLSSMPESSTSNMGKNAVNATNKNE